MDHDRWFKLLLTTFFIEFLELFFPELVSELDRDSIEFLDKEVLTDVTGEERHILDLVVKARFRDQALFFLIHVEPQAEARGNFPRRMFKYFARLHEKHGLAVYPIAVFTYDEPERPEPDEYRIRFSDLDVLAFRFRVVQLNRLNWRRFNERTNPVAAALMAKMRVAPADRPWAKLACLQLLAKLQLDPARRELISAFIDAYLRLTIEEEQVFQAELAKLEPQKREQVMEIVTSWMEKGIEQGIEQGRQQGQRNATQSLVLRQLQKRLGLLEAELEARVSRLSVEQLESLAEALLDFAAPSDLTSWLDTHAPQ